VTDANLTLGRYDPARFAGGSLALDVPAARGALAAQVGEKLHLAPEMAALGVVEMVDENMANAARVHAIESGKTYAGRTMIAFGGGGPVHGYRVAEKIGIDRVLIPSGAGVGSAIGFLRAPVAYEVVRSLYQRFSSFDVAAVNALLDTMVAEAEAIVAEGSFGAATLPARTLTADDVPAIRAEYDAQYSRFYDRPVPGSDVEILSYAVTVATIADSVANVSSAPAAVPATPARTQMVRDTASGEATPWAVYDRAGLARGATLHGPAIIAEDETSTLVGPGWTARIDGRGYIELSRGDA
jgi:N-methylhydantoinase A